MAILLTNRGTPIVSSRQWTYALSPNPRGGWNYIVQSYNYQTTSPCEWVVLKDLTTAPTEQIFETPSGIYANHQFCYPKQLRAANGRIFFPLILNNFAYYDPAAESVHQVGPIAENPPINLHASEQFFSCMFDATGQTLYFGTEESQYRPAMICSVNTDTLVVTVIDYVGDNALSYNMYAYYLAVDTVTAQKWLYVAYGENPWQLWSINLSTGAKLKMKEVSSTGWISFHQYAQGWVVETHTNRGQPDDRYTAEWIIDGVLYPYVPGQNPLPFAPRNVTPYPGTLTNPPDIDASAGIGLVNWRPHSSTGPYTPVNYTVTHATPITIDRMVGDADGVLMNAEQYQGFARYRDDGDFIAWYGPYQVISQGPRARIDGLNYLCGYPNGVLLSYDDVQPWHAGVNPLPLGYFTASDMKHALFLAWSPVDAVLYCAGSRERSGTGGAIGSWNRMTKAFAGTYAGLDQVIPTGLAVLDELDTVIMATRPLVMGAVNGQFRTFDRSLNQTGILDLGATIADPGQIYQVIARTILGGVTTNAAGNLAIYQYDVDGEQLTSYVEFLAIAGIISAECRHPDGTIWVAIGSQLVRISLDNLTADMIGDLTPVSLVKCMAFSGDGTMLFFGGGNAGAEVWTALIT